MSKTKKSSITTNIVTSMPDWVETLSHHKFFHVTLSDDKDYDTQCARIRKAAGPGFQVMLQKTEKDNRTFFLMTSRTSPDPVSCKDIVFSPIRPAGFTTAFPKAAFLNIMLRFSFSQNPFTIGAGADDGKVYLICEKKEHLIYTGAPMFFDEDTAWGALTFISVQSRTFKKYKALTENEIQDKKTRKVKFFQRGTVMSSRKGGDETPYLMGNFAKQRHTLSAYAYKGKGASGDIRAFMMSRSGIVAESLSLIEACCPYVNISQQIIHGETKQISETDLKKRAAFVAQCFPEIRIHDPLQTQGSRNVMNSIIFGFSELEKNMRKQGVDISFNVAETGIEGCHFYLVHDQERYEKNGDLQGQEDAYHLKPFTAQALNADESGTFSSKMVRGKREKQEEKTQIVMIHTMLNELLIKAEVSTRQMFMTPEEVLPEFRAFATIQTLNADRLDIPYEWGHGTCGVQATFSSNGDLTFDIIDDLDEVIGCGLEKNEMAIEVADQVVIIKRTGRGWVLPNLDHIKDAYKEMPDGGNPDIECLPTETYDAAIENAELETEEYFRKRPEMSRTAIIKHLSGFSTEKDISEDEKARRAKSVKLVKDALKADLLVEGVRTNAALGGLLGVFKDEMGTMFSAGLPKGPAGDVGRFPVLYSMQTVSGVPVPDAFLDLIAAHNQRHMRIDTKIFVFKHMREFLKIRLSEQNIQAS